MNEADEYKFYRQKLMRLIVAIDKEISITDDNQVLIVMELKTTENILKFKDWIKGHIKNGKLQATEAEIVRAAVQIDKGII